ncbi:MAG: family 78 glycoside hydrolase catalytic domain [Clostridia bacterium]|nr:family 78 glycoside hydrolase catalytic domain [Clostridia bacterium]
MSNTISKNAKWITLLDPQLQSEMMKKNPWENRLGPEDQVSPLEDCGGIIIFRKTFTVNDLKSAEIRATALGVFELWCNGQRIGADENGTTVYDELKPGWTEYRKRSLFYTYDLAPYLHDGDNVIVAAVANGWYCGRISSNTYEATHPAFLGEILLNDDLGERSVFTDDTWLVARGSSVHTADIWDGELYDARDPSPAEISAGAELYWKETDTEEHDIEVTPHIGPAIRVRKGLDRTPESVTIYNGIIDNGTDFGEINVVRTLNNNSFHLAKGEHAVLDLGQNMVGYPIFTVKGKRDTEIMIRTGEMLNDSGSKERGNENAKGTIYSLNYRSAKSKIQYILRGTPDGESYRPVFTFFGFRYLEISATDDVEILSISALVVGSDTHETGRMETSDATVNQLISNILWGQRGNYLSVPTDCPQRDERLGWTGDTQAFCGTAAYNADVLGFFHKWLQDARDSQLENGEYPDVIPHSRVVGTGGSAWADAGIIVPYTMWKMYADTSIIENQYESMERYMAWLETTEKKGAISRYGDWLAYEPTSKDLISLAYYVLDAQYMAIMSSAIGKSDRTEHYAALAEELKEEFRSVYCNEDGMLLEKHRTQTAYLLSIKLGLLPEKCRDKAIAELKRKIIDNGYKLSTGFVGSCIICEVLAQAGENNLSYSLLLQTENPSWLYSVLQGATTIWERWNSYTKATGFGDVGMNSFNHYAYGAVQEWMYRHIAGIQTTDEHPGFSHPIIAPKPDTRTPDEIPAGQERITHVKTVYESVSGEIMTEWDTSNGFVLHVSVPVESTLYLPILTDKDTMTVNGKPFEIKREKHLGTDVMVIDLKPGKYSYFS